ncbi:MAG: hypothetical protein GX166_07820 [Clostridiaceae bacterium]|nr:hypothetical protein [Clostridiaceae bacterium]
MKTKALACMALAFMYLTLLFSGINAAVVDIDGKEAAINILSKNLKPLKEETISITIPNYPDKLTVTVTDAAGVEYVNEEVLPENGVYTLNFLPRGKAGTHTITITKTNGASASYTIKMLADTVVETENDYFNKLFEHYKTTITQGQSRHSLQKINFKVNNIWLRDHIHMIKASKYFDSDVISGLDFFIMNQTEEGFYYEIIVNSQDIHTTFVKGNCLKPINASTTLIRLEIEADIEYLMAEAIYQAWKATDDLEWLKEVLPSLEKALNYYLTSDKRFDPDTGLVKRGVSIDTWDWVYGQKGLDRNRMIEEDSPMAIFHGDNTGFYQACIMISEMYRAAGDEAKAEKWENTAKDIRKKLMDIAWNGNFFSHIVHIRPTVEEVTDALWKVDFEGDKDRLSLSNAYALNRGILTQQEASRIIETYLELRNNPPPTETNPEKKYYAEWVTLYPSYVNSNAILYPPNDYVNGTISLFVAGELAKGCFTYGYTEYGADILKRVRELYERDKRLQFLYYQDGTPYNKHGGGGPSGWSTAALYSATVEGLCGVHDLGGQFEKARLIPAWANSEYNTAYSSTSYGASDKYIAYTMEHDRDNSKLIYKVCGDSKEIDFQILVPAGNIAEKVLVNGQEMSFTNTQTHNSVYANFKLSRSSNMDIDTIEVTYKAGTLKTGTETEKSDLWMYVIISIAALAVVAAAALLIVKKSKKA